MESSHSWIEVSTRKSTERCCKICSGKALSKRINSVKEMLRELQWEILERRRNCSALTFIYKMTNNLIEIPQKYHPTQLRTSTRHSNEKAFQTYQPRVDAFRYSLLPKTIPFGIHYHQKSYLLQHLIYSNQVQTGHCTVERNWLFYKQAFTRRTYVYSQTCNRQSHAFNGQFKFPNTELPCNWPSNQRPLAVCGQRLADQGPWPALNGHLVVN